MSGWFGLVTLHLSAKQAGHFPNRIIDLYLTLAMAPSAASMNHSEGTAAPNWLVYSRLFQKWNRSAENSLELTSTQSPFMHLLEGLVEVMA
jgi:hypothetical protein